MAAAVHSTALLLVLLTVPASATAANDHRIGVRVMGGVGEFYDRQTGLRFVPRGFNYVRLAPQVENGIAYHSTFDPGRYDRLAADAALSKMHEDGYNIVRVFINEAQVARTAEALSAAYLVNLADFLDLAQVHSIYVFVVLPNLPGYRYYIPIPSGWSFFNTMYLTVDALTQKQQYFHDLITGLHALNAPMDAVFAWEMENEVFFDSNLRPLSDTSGLVTTANGKTYDMANSADKERMVNESLVYWIDQGRQAIVAVDPSALVGVGFFWDQAPHPARTGDPRLVHPGPAIANSAADFIDLHPYPGNGLTIGEMADNFSIGSLRRKPLLMGEFGLQRFPGFLAPLAAQLLQEWQVASCAFGFSGWLMWTWDTDEEGAQFWSALADGAVINTALSPAVRPDACSSGSFPGQDLALRKPVRASASSSVQPPEFAVDGALSTAWNSGDFAPQWIEIDLQALVPVRKIRLVVNQQPDGSTVHRVWGRGAASTDADQLLYEFRGSTTQGQVLEATLPGLGQIVRFVKVETIQSPAWVSWLEVEIYGPTLPSRRRAVRH